MSLSHVFVNLPDLDLDGFEDSPVDKVMYKNLGSVEMYTANIIALLLQGSSYKPQAYRCRAVVLVLGGTGVFHVGGVNHDYVAGSHFDIAPGVLHGFTKVHTTTYLLKCLPDARAVI